MCLKIPVISQKMYKKYEQKVKSIIEVAAKENFRRKQLVTKNKGAA